MNPFHYQRATAPEEAIHVVAATRGAKFLGGGTNLIDLMKYDVEHPTTLVDINHLSFTQITSASDGTTTVGAGVRNSDLANHQTIRTNYPLLSQAILSGASAQLRNMATTGGNLLQRTRCYYFNDTAYTECNKRNPGSGCSALKGFNRIHAILGTSADGDSDTANCIATNPSDMNVALAALNATVHVQGPKGKRSIALRDFHLLPGTTPHIETALKPDELITSVELPPSRFAKHSCYLKVRDRQSYAFALVSVAAGLELDGSTIQSAGLALGGVAPKPWRSAEAEKALVGAPATVETFHKAADLAVAGAKTYQYNAFKVELAKTSIVRALTLAAQGVQA
ncbi:FAD binding domain-containing protein [Edaphobacter aggregans]|uniref:FAD binding domain-containing protein n=1 Tax=Edaphobacter aggregans TaxID=570835 RepID=UPI00054EA637|nr:xanthine dehydrogenase family protein subunit M [Edaphobacter aggregans]